MSTKKGPTLWQDGHKAPPTLQQGVRCRSGHDAVRVSPLFSAPNNSLLLQCDNAHPKSFTKAQAGPDYPELAKEAVTAALRDARLSYNAVEAVVAGYCYGEPTCGESFVC